MSSLHWTLVTWFNFRSFNNVGYYFFWMAKDYKKWWSEPHGGWNPSLGFRIMGWSSLLPPGGSSFYGGLHSCSQSHTPDNCQWHPPEAHQRWLRWWYSRGRWTGWQRWTECGSHRRNHLGTRAASSWYPDAGHRRTCSRQARGLLSHHKHQCRVRAIYRSLQNLGQGRELD